MIHNCLNMTEISDHKQSEFSYLHIDYDDNQRCSVRNVFSRLYHSNFTVVTIHASMELLF